MKKNGDTNRSAATGHVEGKMIGRARATKFLQVEGMSLNSKSARTLSDFTGRGLKGDALRSAIHEAYAKKRV